MGSLVRSFGIFLLAQLIFLSVAAVAFSQEVSFSEEQVSLGKQLYDNNCATCHGVNLEGAAVIPSLADSTFMNKWSSAPLSNFAAELRQMPPGNQSMLNRDHYQSITAYILAANGVAFSEVAATEGLDFDGPLNFPELISSERFEEEQIAEGAEEILQRYSSVSEAMLLDPPEEDWLIWQGSYDNQGFSALNQINRETVADLALSWRMPLQTGVNNPGPLVHDGIMYLFTFPDTVLAIDAVDGALLWRYEHQSEVQSSQKKGVALYGDLVFVPTSDLHVLALDARSGGLVWDYKIETSDKYEGYHLRMSPLVVGDTVIQGITSLRIPEGGWIDGIDRLTGERKWRFYTIPRPGEPGGDSWNGIPMEERSGGSVWNPQTLIQILEKRPSIPIQFRN